MGAWTDTSNGPFTRAAWMAGRKAGKSQFYHAQKKQNQELNTEHIERISNKQLIKNWEKRLREQRELAREEAHQRRKIQKKYEELRWSATSRTVTDLQEQLSLAKLKNTTFAITINKLKSEIKDLNTYKKRYLQFGLGTRFLVDDAERVQ